MGESGYDLVPLGDEDGSPHVGLGGPVVYISCLHSQILSSQTRLLCESVEGEFTQCQCVISVHGSGGGAGLHTTQNSYILTRCTIYHGRFVFARVGDVVRQRRFFSRVRGAARTRGNTEKAVTLSNNENISVAVSPRKVNVLS